MPWPHGTAQTWQHRLPTALLPPLTQPFSVFSVASLSISSAGEAGGAGEALGRRISAALCKRHLPAARMLTCCECPFLSPDHPTRCHHCSFLMGSSCSFHYNYHREEMSRYLTWLKRNHWAKMRNKLPLVTKALSQADCFGMSNFDVLAQIHGSRVTQETGPWGSPVKELRSQKNCCQADSKEGARAEQTRPKTWIPGWS